MRRLVLPHSYAYKTSLCIVVIEAVLLYSTKQYETAQSAP